MVNCRGVLKKRWGRECRMDRAGMGLRLSMSDMAILRCCRFGKEVDLDERGCLPERRILDKKGVVLEQSALDHPGLLEVYM